MEIELEVQKTIERFPNATFVIACSGGVDSMCLLALFRKFSKKVMAMHVNYHLRGNDSILDSQCVVETCKKLNVPYEILNIDLNTYLEEKGGNLQDVARRVRYDFFESKIKNTTNMLVVGHHFEDQIETFFLNLARGGGMMALSSMTELNGHILRPLLKFEKSAIIDYAKKNHITWREDQSNSSNKYRRNKLRNQILPELYEKLPTLKQSVALLIKTFQENQLELEQKIANLSSMVTIDRVLDDGNFDLLNDFEKIELLRQLKIPFSLLNELNKLRTSLNGKKILLNHSIFSSIQRQQNQFVFIKHELPAKGLLLQCEDIKKAPSVFNKNELIVDPVFVEPPLQLRLWRSGDRMKPKGMKGTKSIAAILKDAKVPSYLRNSQWIVEDQNRILWLVGYAVADTFDEHSKTFQKFSITS